MVSEDRDNAFVCRRDVLVGSLGMLALSSCQSPPPADASAPSQGRPAEMDRFVADCVAAGRESDAQAAIKEVLARGVRDPAAMLAAVGEPTRAGLTVFHRSPTLTIFAAAWTPLMNLMPHNHRMWALIGIYTGREDNIFWQQSPGGLQACGAECLFAGGVAALPDTAIHSVTNPLERFTGGIHIYGGDFFASKRSQWDPESLAEQPSDGEVIRRIFERANERMARMRGA
jgi:predicted metal-dependent enzyme (double-stranded beta helix superfamily)